MPAVVGEPAELRRRCDRIRAAGQSLGLVPTMGALHAGHRSLIVRSRAECDRTAVSIFVNPTQFGAGEDLDRYPRTLEVDLALCAELGVDLVYTPSVETAYPEGFATRVGVRGVLTETLEGAHRPGHFEGVATIVAKLLVTTRPDRAYFGHKDAQQCAVVRRLASDLDTGAEVVVCPTVRDADGLALSSRNLRLDAGSRRQALAIPAALAAADAAHRAGETDPERIRQLVLDRLARSPDLAVDYVAVVDADTFEPAAAVSVRCEILIAARIGGTRLIDVLTPGADERLAVGVGG
ncbi:MAG: pantoate--beta-alanine ligase [Candidatus Dormibacteria bacterium]